MGSWIKHPLHCDKPQCLQKSPLELGSWYIKRKKKSSISKNQEGNDFRVGI